MSLWGLSISTGKKYYKIAEHSFNLTAATLDLQSSHGNDVYSVMCEDENGTNYVICNLSLKHNIIQVPLDLQFYKGDKASFSVIGPEGNVHLTGSYLMGYDEESDNDTDSEVEQEEEEAPQLVTGRRKRKSPEEKSPKLSIKKQKLKDGESALKLAESILEKTKNKKLKKDVSKDKSTKKDAEKDESMTLSDLLNGEEEEESDADEDFTMDGVNVEDSDDESEEDEEEDDDDDEDEEEEGEDDEGEGEEAEAEEEDDEDEYEDMDDEDATDEEKDEKSPLPSKKNANSPGNTPLPKKNKKANKAEKLGQSQSENQAVTESTKSKKKKNKNKQNKENENTPNGTATKSPSEKRTKLMGGVVVEDLKVGSGQEVKNGKMISLYYEGKLKNSGRVFDKQLSGDCFRFRLGQKEVIKGWDVGLMGMKVGGKRRVIVPPAMAYGSKGAPPAIPPNSVLVFDVEVKGIS